MALTSNQLVKQVDLPVWEWLRPAPTATTAGLAGTSIADNQQFSAITGRYIFKLINATNFWRYDTISDTYQQMASPGITPLTASSLRVAGAAGYCGRAISATSTTITTGLPYAGSAVGFRIKIISGKGSGQERMITAVDDPVIADFGGASAGAATSLTDITKNWGLTGSSQNGNTWIGYVVRIVGGTGVNQVRKILYSGLNTLIIADPNVYSYDPWCEPMSPTAGTGGWTAPASGSLYQIESCVVTVDTAWDVQPDNTSRYVIQAGGVWLASGASVANGSITMQFYSILEDIWYAKRSMSNMVPTLLTDLSLERFTENSAMWYTGQATAGTTTSLTDANAQGWVTNGWAGYYAFIWTGTGRGQLGIIASNTTTALTFSNTLSIAPDTTSRYNIMGYDAGTLTSTSGRIVFDSTKSWPVNRWSNYTIRIVAGVGIGQTRQIMSNGSDSIVVYDVWNTQPDNTSVYQILPDIMDMVITLGANAETYLYRSGDLDMISHGRILDEGVLQLACAILCDGTSTATHQIYDQRPVAITGLSGTTTITATTAVAHPFKVGQWVSIRGVTSAAADVYNVTGKVQILTTPTGSSFTYTPFGTGSGTYSYSYGVSILPTVLIDASKFHADLATGGSTTSITFTRAQPSNINGWYVYGTNIAAGAQVSSGAGTTTLNLNLTGAGTPSGTIIFSKWPRPETAAYSSGGGAGVFTTTISGTVPAYAKGWLATGTNLGIGSIVTGGEGTSVVNFSVQNSGTPSGTITFSNPVNNPLPATSTYSSGSGTAITLTGNSPTYITGWYVSGTNIANGTTVIGGAGTGTITLSTATSGTPSGTLTFYPPSTAIAMYYGTGAAPAITATGFLAAGTPMQLTSQSTVSGTIMVPLASVGTATAGTSTYVLARRDMIGQQYAGQTMTYLSGVSFGTQSITSLVDNNSFWSGPTGSGGSAGATTFTISAPGSPAHNGWYVSGSNIPTGAKVIAGAGTTSITIDVPLTGSVSGTVTFTAWQSLSLVGRRLRVLSSTGANQELTITSVNPGLGTLAFATAVASGTGTSSYTILPTIIPGLSTNLCWQSDSKTAAKRGRYLIRARGGAAAGFDRIDLTTDQFYPQYTIPTVETLGSGSMYTYDQLDRIYFTKDVTNRVYYLDLNTWTINGAGLFPYTVGTAGIGNNMEMIITADNLKYLWVQRQQQVEVFRQLVFY